MFGFKNENIVFLFFHWFCVRTIKEQLQPHIIHSNTINITVFVNLLLCINMMVSLCQF